MAMLESGHTALVKLCKALGLQGRHVQKIILEVAVDDIPRLYVKEICTAAQTDALAEALEGLKVIPVENATVTDGCEVIYTEKGA